LIGCGAIAETAHLPALLRDPSVRSRLILVDPAAERVEQLARQHGINITCADFREILDQIDGAVVAAPPRFHYSVSLACLERRVHVLCEKPLCVELHHAEELVEASKRTGAVLAVNQTRRLFPAFQHVRELLASHAIGRPRRLTYELGEAFDWPAASDSYFGAKGGGKGVLLDLGAHIVDLVAWWLGGRPQVVDYRDDSFGGTEAVAQADLEYQGCRISIRLSWLSRLRNVYRIDGDTGSIEGGFNDWATLTLRAANGSARRIRTADQPKRFDEFPNRLIDNFLDVIRTGTAPIVPAREVLPSLQIISECYARRAQFDMPWIGVTRIGGGNA
jgi:predicted dehydrogenase